VIDVYGVEWIRNGDEKGERRECNPPLREIKRRARMRIAQ